jgi:hypothetical protein
MMLGYLGCWMVRYSWDSLKRTIAGCLRDSGGSLKRSLVGIMLYTNLW